MDSIKSDYNPCTCHCLIIGGGLSGIATAIALRQYGHRVTIFERMAKLQEIGAGIQLPPNATRLLDRWGILDQVEEHSYRPVGGTMRSYTGKVLLHREDSAAVTKVFRAPYLVIHRADLLAVLVKEAIRLGVDIKLNSVVTQIEFETSLIRLSTGESYIGDMILGADGERSICREALLERSDLPRATGDVVYRLAVSGDAAVNHCSNLARLGSASEINLWLGPDAHAVSYLLKKGNMLNVVLICPDERTDLPFGPQLAELNEVKRRFGHWDPEIADLLDVPNIECTKWSLLQIDELQSWIHEKGTFALIGDAAHAMLPYLAQGAAQAFEDAAFIGCLFSKIKDKLEISRMLQIYQQARKPRVVEIQQRTLMQKNMFGLRDGPEQEKRDSELSDGTNSAQPNMLTDHQFQYWLWGYDAEKDAARALKEDISQIAA